VIWQKSGPAGGTVRPRSLNRLKPFQPSSLSRSAIEAGPMGFAPAGSPPWTGWATITAGRRARARVAARRSLPAAARAEPEATAIEGQGPAPAAGHDRLEGEAPPPDIRRAGNAARRLPPGGCLGGPQACAQHPAGLSKPGCRQGEGRRAGAPPAPRRSASPRGASRPRGYVGGSSGGSWRDRRGQATALGGPWRARRRLRQCGARPVFPRERRGWRQLREWAQPVAHR